MDWSIVILAFSLAVVLIASHHDTSARIGRIEHKVNLMLQRSGIDLGERVALSERVKRIADDPARQINAIKAYREETGAGLLAAKEALDAYVSSRR